jgi:hypothetical protein
VGQGHIGSSSLKLHVSPAAAAQAAYAGAGRFVKRDGPSRCRGDSSPVWQGAAYPPNGLSGLTEYPLHDTVSLNYGCGNPFEPDADLSPVWMHCQVFSAAQGRRSEI